MTVSAGYDTLCELASGQLELSHEALDTVDRGQSTRVLRAALDRTGVLAARAEQTAKLDAFTADQVARRPAGEIAPGCARSRPGKSSTSCTAASVVATPLVPASALPARRSPPRSSCFSGCTATA